MMMDHLREKKSLSDDEDMKFENKKFCSDCKTTKTPLWRGGPAGPKSLCNACGIRFRKKRRAMAALDRSIEKKRDRSQAAIVATTTTNPAETVGSKTSNGLSECLKKSLMVLGKEVLLQRLSSSVVKKQRCQRRRKLGEEEQAAFSLMALSCGSVLA